MGFQSNCNPWSYTQKKRPQQQAMYVIVVSLCSIGCICIKLTVPRKCKQLVVIKLLCIDVFIFVQKKLLFFIGDVLSELPYFLSDAIVIEQNSFIRFVVPDFLGIIYFLGNIFCLRF